jgi:conjugative transfer signal peptidase TraF
MRGYFGPGFCPGRSDYLMKRVWGLPGDRVSVQSDGVWINGARVPNSAPLASDQAGRPLPQYRAHDVVLLPGQYLLLSELHPRSFDGRYFGAVDRKQIVAVIRPLFVWQLQRRT